MKLGIISGWDEPGLAYAAAKGLGYVEFCVNVNVDTFDFLGKVPEIQGYCKKYNIKVGSMGRWGVHPYNDEGAIDETVMQDYRNLIDAAAKLGCPVFNAGCNYLSKLSFLQNCQNAIKLFRALVDYAADKNVKIAAYNCSWGDNFVVEPKAWEIVLSAVPEMGIKYDTSHCLGRGGDYLKEMRDWGDRFYHFHLKGSLYVDGQHYDDPPIGLDCVNWGAVFDILYTKNYDAMVSLEPHSRYWRGHEGRGDWGVEFSIKYAKQFLMPEEN